MRRWTMFALAVAALVLPACATHHVYYPDGTEKRTYVEWETDTDRWGKEYHEYGE